MQEIKVTDESIEKLFSSHSYRIDYYQRGYKWSQKQFQELVDDLSFCFLNSYESDDDLKKVSKYDNYFLGSIVVSGSEDIFNVVDGQQRLTSLSILLIYLNNLQKKREQTVNIEKLIYADNFGEKTFMLNVQERNDCMEALFNNRQFNTDEASESVHNLYARYHELDELFPEVIQEEALLHFIYWFKGKIKIIKIATNADNDAYKIFETMNDRGISLTPTDMLKGYLLNKIDDPNKRDEADKLIRKHLSLFAEHGKEANADFFKTWLRSQYSTKIRERKKDADPEDFDLIGTEYHRWLRKHAADIKLNSSDDFYKLVAQNFEYFASLYLRLLNATKKTDKDLESVRYNADAGFTLQHHVILASITPTDDKETAIAKASVVADFLDIWINLRLWNYKSINYSSIQYAVFQMIRSIRGKSLEEVQTLLYDRLRDEMKEMDFSQPVIFDRKQSTSKAIHRILARFIDWLEKQADEAGKYENYIIRSGKNAFEIEHIWADHYDRFEKEFTQPSDFSQFRNQIGGLLLLPKKKNASLGDKTYKQKLPRYLQENILAQSLHEDAYKNNPGFQQTFTKHNLPFRSHEDFSKNDLKERSDLYCKLAALIWSPDRLRAE